MSRMGLFVILFFGILVIGLTILGSMRLFNYDKLSYELSVLRDKTNLLENLLSDMEFSQVMDSSIAYEKFISNILF